MYSTVTILRSIIYVRLIQPSLKRNSNPFFESFIVDFDFMAEKLRVARSNPKISWALILNRSGSHTIKDKATHLLCLKRLLLNKFVFKYVFNVRLICKVWSATITIETEHKNTQQVYRKLIYLYYRKS